MKIKGLLADMEREREVQTPLPLHVVLLIDCSGSIKEHLEAVKRAASGLAEQVREKGKVGVVSFGGKGVQIKNRLTDNERALRKAFASLKAGGASPMGTAISLADRSLTLEKKGEILYENASYALMETFQGSGEKLDPDLLHAVILCLGVEGTDGLAGPEREK